MLGTRWVNGAARANADRAAAAVALTHRELLSSELQKFRLLPVVLAEYPDVAAALGGDDAEAVLRLDRTLELLAQRTDAAVLYAIDRQGRAVAASNWRLPSSFVGQDYTFRRYFGEAMAQGSAELFALGSVSGRPGLYLARRIDRNGRPLGVIVVKVEFDRLERDWRRTLGSTVVRDANGVILIASMPDLRFRTTQTLSPRLADRLRRSRQFGEAPALIPAFARDGGDVLLDRQRFRVAAVAAPLAGGRLLHLTPLAPALAAARTQAMLWGAGLLLLAILIATAVRRAAERERVQTRVRAALEDEVGRRTVALQDANARLLVESEERAAADRRFRAAREELAQANRLGSLGQITAGVAHEINQPVAAIRAFAENGIRLLDRDARDAVRDNLGRIVALTDRIGAITGELRAFARRRTPSPGTPTLDEAIAGTLLLIGDRARGVVEDRVSRDVRLLKVGADRIRLEQILVNLIHNALDATSGRDVPRVTIEAVRHGDAVALRVADNGPGVDPAIADTLFTPFVTGKVGGLGLGLAIARDIARAFGGDLALDSQHDAGAVFVLTLRVA